MKGFLSHKVLYVGSALLIEASNTRLTNIYMNQICTFIENFNLGQLNPDTSSGMISLKASLEEFFKGNSYGVVTARGGSMAVWKGEDHLYLFEPHGCDNSGEC